MTEKYMLVVAIDIGTTYSGYAYQFRTEHEENPMAIKSPQCWIAGDSRHVSNKTASSLLLDENKKFLSFGFDAETDYANHPNPEELYLFRRFKMELYENRKISSKMEVCDFTKKKKGLALDVFSLSIKALKDDFFQHARNTNAIQHIVEERILWVITVPAIWSASAKTFMTESAKKAGIEESQISIALEPEAGAICCQTYVSRLSNLNDAGCRYLVADLGGGTADLTVHEKLKDGTLKELHKADGINCGGVDVDKRICGFLSELADLPDMFDLERDAPNKLCDHSFFDIHRSIENLKRQIKHETNNDISYDFPFLKMQNDEEPFQDLKILSKKFCERKGPDVVVHRFGRKLLIKSSLLKTLFEETIKKIIQRIEKVLSESSDAKSIGIILLVGGFSESSLVSGKIREHFKDKNVVVPDNDAGLSILKGAVLYGYDNDIIISRILTHSYGYQVCRKFDPTTDSGRETFTEDGETYCRGVFSEIVPANKEIKKGDEAMAVVSPISDFSFAIQVDFYACPNRTPNFVDDPECIEIGEIQVPLLFPLPGDRPVILFFQFGGTLIKVKAVDTIIPIPIWTNLKLKEKEENPS